MAQGTAFYVNHQNNYKKKILSYIWSNNPNKWLRNKQNIKHLHSMCSELFNDSNILEVSSYSNSKVGIAASAFNLKMKTTKGIFTVEQLFQSSKNFKNHGTQEKLLDFNDPTEIKSCVRSLNNKDSIINFKLFDDKYPIEPKTFFYNWIYCNALRQHPLLARHIIQYSIFTDINFNFKYGINCQAESCSIFAALCRKHQLKAALKDKNSFLKLVYGESSKEVI
ncbi:DarT1-associated NADAR antitoxin family protein [Apilactobacillus timberlakei]|uniref:DarT1-associated NADAR antitoxin family protein n=1 Tax=Apilactobacillus timberlakei TaxID=2008380 RepID=UPI00112A4282|nr:hypothetical protein [Apilactobacillus timberlakei]TPR16283.1 hypothetical protein DYZ95_07905 [Apilactobacillus timberlakei]TPR21546.1 hypothetical protein DY083_05865 [Apilactobacillus timberlakei]